MQPVEELSPTDVPRRVDRSSRRLVDDVGQALAVWREQPALPVMSALYGVLTALSASGGALWLSIFSYVLLAFIGWVGVERLWYLRAFTGRQMTPGEALRWSLRYFGRFFRLFLLGFMAMVPIMAVPMFVVISRTDQALHPGGDARLRLALFLYFAAVALVVDFALTFVTPALVYSTDSAIDAVRIGFRLLRATWPHAAPYVVLPPLAVAFLMRGPAGAIGLLGDAIIVLSALLTLLARGTICAYYLRIMTPVGPDGAYSELRHPSYATYATPHDGT